MATKLRALYQRRKGRDLFDLWHVASQKLINLDRVVEIFAKYCDNDGLKISGEEFIKNLEFKKQNKDFKLDVDFLLPQNRGWDFEKAYQFVLKNVVSRLP